MILATRTIKLSDWTPKFEAQLSDSILVEVGDIPDRLQEAIQDAKRKLEALGDDEPRTVKINDNGTATVKDI